MEVKRGLLGISIVFFSGSFNITLGFNSWALLPHFRSQSGYDVYTHTEKPAHLPHNKHGVTVEEVQHHQAYEDGCCCGCALGSGYAISSPADKNRLWKPAHALYTCTNKQKQLDTRNKTRSTTLPVEIQNELGPLFWNAGQRAPITGLAALFWVAEGRLSARNQCRPCTGLSSAVMWPFLCEKTCCKIQTRGWLWVHKKHNCDCFTVILH